MGAVVVGGQHNPLIFPRTSPLKMRLKKLSVISYQVRAWEKMTCVSHGADP